MNFFCKYLILCCCSSIVAVACNNNRNNRATTFKMIDFTYDSGWETAYSFKIDSVGNIVFAMGRWSKTFYIGKLNNRQLKRLDSFYNATPFKTFDTTYADTHSDLTTTQIVILSRNKSMKFYVYGDRGPKKLKEFINYLRSIESNVRLNRIDTIIEFESLKGIYQTPPQNK